MNSTVAEKVLLRLQGIHRRVKPDESSVFMHHLLLHQCIITQQEPTWSEDLTEGKNSCCLLRLELQLYDFSQVRLLHFHSSLMFGGKEAMKPTQPSLPKRDICFPPLGSLKELNILQLPQLCQIRVKSASSFRCHG